MHICNALSLTPDLKASHQIKSTMKEGIHSGALFLFVAFYRHLK